MIPSSIKPLTSHSISGLLNVLEEDIELLLDVKCLPCVNTLSTLGVVIELKNRLESLRIIKKESNDDHNSQ